MNESFAHGGEQNTAQATEIRKQPRLEVEDYAAQADYISFTIAHEDDSAKGRELAHKEYVENEENPDLQKFGKMMLIAKHAAEESVTIKKLNVQELELRQRGQQLSDGDTERLHRSVRIECAYNQMLESMIIANEEALPKEKMTEWLARASNNREWAATHMSGVAGEIAGGKILRLVPAIKELNHGDLDEDMAGKDFVFESTMMGVSGVDVKTGAARPKLPVTHSQIHSDTLLLSLNPAHFDKTGYAIDEKYAPAYIEELSNKL